MVINLIFEFSKKMGTQVLSQSRKQKKVELGETLTAIKIVIRRKRQILPGSYGMEDPFKWKHLTKQGDGVALMSSVKL